MTLADFTAVWTPLSALFAIIAGGIYGSAVGWVATNPAYSSTAAGPVRIGLLTAAWLMSGGLVFFALQTLGTYLSGDPNWPRVMSRYGQWVLFSIVIGLTTWFLVRHDRARRRRHAHDAVAGEAQP